MIDFVKDLYHTYRHIRFVRLYESAKNTRWNYGVYLRSGDSLRDVRSVVGTTWTLDNGQTVDTKEIAHMAIARLEMGYS